MEMPTALSGADHMVAAKYVMCQNTCRPRHSSSITIVSNMNVLPPHASTKILHSTFERKQFKVEHNVIENGQHSLARRRAEEYSSLAL